MNWSRITKNTLTACCGLFVIANYWQSAQAQQAANATQNLGAQPVMRTAAQASPVQTAAGQTAPGQAAQASQVTSREQIQQMQ